MHGHHGPAQERNAQDDKPQHLFRLEAIVQPSEVVGFVCIAFSDQFSVRPHINDAMAEDRVSDLHPKKDA